MFCVLLLRKAEAADLQLGDTEVSLDKLSGQILIVGGLHKYLFIHIKRSKTDHSDQGRELLISTTILSNFCVDNIINSMMTFQLQYCHLMSNHGFIQIVRS